MRRIALLTIFLVALSSGPAFALSLVSQDPHFSTFVIGVEEPVTLVFDASLDPATVTLDDVGLTRVDDGAAVAGGLFLQTTNLENDTVVFTPNADLRFGVRYRIELDGRVKDTGGVSFNGVFPFDTGIFGGREFVPNVPRDLQFPTCAPDDTACLMELTNVYMAFNPIDPESTNPAAYWTIPGISATEAWKWATGRPDVLVAIIDDGMSTYDNPELRDRLYLNKGELAGDFMPRIGDTPCGVYDCNGDGRFSASDYDLDNRLLALSGGEPITVKHLLQAFSDGIDSDGNGYVDDISGYDLFRNVNETLGVEEFPEGTHGDGAESIAGQAENGYGSKIGFCPNCTVLPIRVSDAVVADFNVIAAGARYASMMGARIAAVAMGSFNTNDETAQAFIDAFDGGMLTVAAGGDEMGMHHLWPAAGEDVINIKALFPFPPTHILNLIPVEWVAFTESYCTNFGAHTDISVPAGHICTSEAVHNSAGAAGLILSRARDVGIELTAAELRQIIIMSADDIKDRCVSLVEGPSMGGVCHAGFDEHFGYGRFNMKKAFDMLGYPELGLPAAVPPVARIREPWWWGILDPDEASHVDVVAQMSSRVAAYHWEVQAAPGVQPYDNEFKVLAQGDETGPVNGPIATVDVASVMARKKWADPPASANDKTITLRLRVWSTENGGSVMGEARKALQLQKDDNPETGLVPSFPIELGASGESSPRLYDLDGDPDGKLEIIFGTSAGTVEVYKYMADSDSWEPAPGFPVDISGDNGRFSDGLLATPSVADIDADGRPEIVAATMGGRVYAIHGDGNLHEGGPLLAGFPVETMTPSNDTSYDFGHGNGVIASPALADLDGDGLLEIIIGAYDQRVYAWKPVGATLMPGWPVLLSSDPVDGLVAADKLCDVNPLPGQVLGSPAVGILDPANADPDIALHPSVIVAVTEVCNNDPMPTSRVYAIYWNGQKTHQSPFLPGWPAKVLVPLGDAIPVPPLTSGATNSPIVYIPPDGQARIAVGSFLWLPQLIRWDGQATNMATYAGKINLTTSSNGAFAHLRGDDSMQFLLPTMGALNKIDGKIKVESWNIVGFDLENFGQLAFRQRWEDIQFFVNPIVGDISGDTLPEVIAGSGGFIVHAYDINGREPEDWPKATHGWGIASAALGDIDNDGLLEAVIPMHEGRLFAWETRGKECLGGRANSDWRTFHHDERSTGFYNADTLPPRMVTDFDVTDNGDGTFDLSFTAPGDDLGCGTVAGYEVRYSTNAGTDLRPLDAFNAASAATVLTQEFVQGGARQTIRVTAPADAAAFSVRAFDDQGLDAWPSPTAVPHAPSPADDDAASDDDADDDIVSTPPPAAINETDTSQSCGCGL